MPKRRVVDEQQIADGQRLRENQLFSLAITRQHGDPPGDIDPVHEEEPENADVVLVPAFYDREARVSIVAARRRDSLGLDQDFMFST